MRIQLLNLYRGHASREAVYEKGEYDTADLEPSLVTYWLHSGFAVAVDAPIVIEQPPKTRKAKVVTDEVSHDDD